MCDKGGVQGKKTNHSLRAYAATELFQAGVSEKVIQNRSGHPSLEGLRKYERISEEQKRNACRVLAPYAEKEQVGCCCFCCEFINMTFCCIGLN